MPNPVSSSQNVDTEVAQIVRERCSKTSCGAEWTGAGSTYECPECGGRSLRAEEIDALENTAPWAIEAIRRNERLRVSALLDESAASIGAFAADGPSAVRMVAYMLTLKDS